MKDVSKNQYNNLQEATIKALYNQLDDEEKIRDVEGVIDDVLVITDPEISKDEYDEVIERANEIIENTPEGEIPFDEEYLGQYLQTCPICGNSFVEDHLLEPGATCPICLEQPEAFIVIGRVDSDESIIEDLGLETDAEMEEETEQGMIDVENNTVPETAMEQPTEETDELPERSGGRRASNMNREVASKEVPQGNKLAEGKVEETAVRDVAEKINADSRYNNENLTTLKGMLADKIADIAEDMGDDYSEWLNEEEVEYLINTILVSSVWTDFEEKLDELIKDQIEDRVDWIRKDDPASKYYDGNLSEFEESKKVIEANISKEIIVINNNDETYTINPEEKTYTIKTPKGEKTFTFEKMDEFVDGYRGSNRIYKPMSVLAYTDYKNGKINKWL